MTYTEQIQDLPRREREVLGHVEDAVASTFEGDSSGHDLHHLRRVCNLALRLQREEGGDRLTVAAAALTHDVHRMIQNETGTFCPPKDSLPQVEAVLSETNLSSERKADVLHCVEYHEEYGFSENGRSVRDLETLLLQDADNLDAMGAVGIARTFAHGGAHGVPIFEPSEELEGTRHYDPGAEGDPSVLHHFRSKLLKLKGNMHTATAQALAQKRHRYMEGFVETFLSEWAGEQ